MSTRGGQAREGRARAGAGGGGSAAAVARQSEDLAAIHERAARLQREGNLPREAQPGEQLVSIRDHLASNAEIARMAHGTTTAQDIVSSFGAHQMGNALSNMAMDNVRYIARQEGVSAAGTKAEIVSRITAKMTEGRYSANFERAAAEKPAKSPSPAARQSAALERARTALPEASEPQRLRTALMEAAAERLANDPAFAARVRARYAEGGQATKADTASASTLSVVRTLPTHAVNVYAAPNPHYIRALYGDAQFKTALQRYSLSVLQRIAREEMGIEPGKTKAATITAILAHTRVVSEDESARIASRSSYDEVRADTRRVAAQA